MDAWLNKDFSISLDNYSRLVGNSVGIEMNDFNDLTKYVNEFYQSNMTTEEYARSWAQGSLENVTSQCAELGTCEPTKWAVVTKGVNLINEVGSFDAASISAELGRNLNEVAETIATAANVGISTDLEAAAAGLGYDSFADAVAAYNEQYGTSYTAEQAAEALGN